MLTPEALRAEIERYLVITGMKPTRFGMEAARDPRFVFDLRDGREPRRATMQRVVDFMSRPVQQKGRAA